MRVAVFFLVLINLLFLAFAQGLFGRPPGPDAGRLQKEVHPELLRIVSKGEPPARPKPEGESASAEPAASAVAAPATAAGAESVQRCLAWDNLPKEAFAQLKALIEKDFPALPLTSKVLAPENTQWWVFIPSLGTKAAAERKASELKRRNLNDFFVVQESGPLRWSISLGVFSSESAARARLSDLSAQGIKSAQVGPRNAPEMHLLEVRGPSQIVDTLKGRIQRTSSPCNPPAP